MSISSEKHGTDRSLQCLLEARGPFCLYVFYIRIECLVSVDRVPRRTVPPSTGDVGWNPQPRRQEPRPVSGRPQGSCTRGRVVTRLHRARVSVPQSTSVTRRSRRGTTKRKTYISRRPLRSETSPTVLLAFSVRTGSHTKTSSHPVTHRLPVNHCEPRDGWPQATVNRATAGRKPL